jgi:hypothetical protein
MTRTSAITRRYGKEGERSVLVLCLCNDIDLIFLTGLRSQAEPLRIRLVSSRTGGNGKSNLRCATTLFPLIRLNRKPVEYVGEV